MEKPRYWWPHAVIIIDILVYLGFGIAFLVAPAELLDAMDIALHSDAALAEIRGMYGGVQLGLGLYLLGYFKGWVSLRQALALAALCIGLLGTFRMIGVLLMPETHPLSLQFAGIELFGLAANASAWWMAREPAR